MGKPMNTTKRRTRKQIAQDELCEAKQKKLNQICESFDSLVLEVENLKMASERSGASIEHAKSSTFKFTKVRDVHSPVRGHDDDAGVDFFIPDMAFGAKKEFDLKSGERLLIPSGIKLDIPKGYALIMYNKSGVSSKLGLLVGACVIDESYEGELHINIFNASNKITKLFAGMKIIQGVFTEMTYFMPEECDIDKMFYGDTTRGENGFGSTGD